MPVTAAEIASHVRGELIGEGSVEILSLAPADSARPGDLTFADKKPFFDTAEHSQASAILVTREFSTSSKVLIQVANPRIAMAKILPLFFPPDRQPPGIHPTATVHPSASVDPTAHIGPGCVLGERVRVGARTSLLGGNYIGRDTTIGGDVTLFPNVVVYSQTKIGNRVSIHAGTVIGSDGYGYVFDEGRHLKVLQVGHVVIEDDVEIGANSAIDRAALGITVIGKGTKIDNLVHVAHNVVMGKHCLVMGQCGFAGSTHLGDYCIIASQSGVAGHLKIGQQAIVAAKSGVMRDVPDKGRVLGIPAAPDLQAKRQMIALQQLPELIKRTRELEKEVAALKAASAPPAS